MIIALLIGKLKSPLRNMPDVSGRVALGPFSLHGITSRNNHLPPNSETISYMLDHKRDPQNPALVSSTASSTEVYVSSVVSHTQF